MINKQTNKQTNRLGGGGGGGGGGGDINKDGYPASLPVISEKLRPGGVLIIDNMIWHGAIFDANDHSASTEGVREITCLLTTDPGWVSTLLAPARWPDCGV